MFLFAIVFSLIIKNPGGDEEESTDDEEEPKQLNDDEEYMHEEDDGKSSVNSLYKQFMINSTWIQAAYKTYLSGTFEIQLSKNRNR